ncbi:kunitz-type protease inhibitor 4 [Alexandromys fortis]|uniref:kunitz-type protease inhibitor 4 n=1 Tax=Alexandromys fortis TaxID=100897 RepID=UPI00215272B5|nr:kunitz-type protease inhibitor 4 [Microtus fortis]
MEARGMRLALWLLTFYMLMQMLSSELFAPGVKRELCESGYLGAKTALCNHPVRRGFCGLHLYRYYFNKITLLCEPFVFSGCGGNRNNFKSKYLCEFYCINKQTQATQDSPHLVEEEIWLTGSTLQSRPHLEENHLTASEGPGADSLNCSR